MEQDFDKECVYEHLLSRPASAMTLGLFIWGLESPEAC